MSPASRAKVRSDPAVDLTGVSGADWFVRQVDTTSLRPTARDLPETELENQLRIDHLESDVFQLEARLAHVEGARVVTIDTMAPEKIDLLKPFHVNIEPCDDGFSASFVDANLMAFGETQPEAIWNLKDLIAGTIEALIEAGEENLGPGPARQLDVLRQFMRW